MSSEGFIFYMGNSIKELEDRDRPREKLLELGVKQLSTSELLAIVLGSGNKDQNAVELAQDILKDHKHSLSELSKNAVNDLTKYKGVGEAKAINVIATLELGKRRSAETPLEKPSITSSKDTFTQLYPFLSDLNTEHFYLMTLNRANTIIKMNCISQGGFSATVADPKLIFKCALEQNASSIILAHNHPSGNLKPSQEDLNLTTKISEAGKLLDLSLLDHIIIAGETYTSFADSGYLS